MRLFLFALILFYLPGCVYFHHVGKSGVSWSQIQDPGFLMSKETKKDDVVRMMGAPDLVYSKGAGQEVWVYRLSRAFYLVVYGESEYRDLYLSFQGDVLSSYKYLPKGGSTAVFIPGSIVR